MVFFQINMKNYNNGTLDKLNGYLTNKKSKIFILFYMEGCGPCIATRPEWAKLKNVLSADFLNRKDIVIVSIDKDLFGKLKNIKKEPTGFPTIRFLTNNGREEETYEDSQVSTKDRSIDSFVEWIQLKSGENNITMSTPKSRKTRHAYKKGGAKKRRKTFRRKIQNNTKNNTK